MVVKPSFNPGIWAQEPQSGLLVMVSKLCNLEENFLMVFEDAESLIHLALLLGVFIKLHKS